MSRPRTMRPSSVLVTLVTALLAFASATPASAEKPVRTVVAAEGFVDPAGLICPFAVSGEPDERAGGTVTHFSDGRTVVHGRGDPTLTNLETGASLVHHSKYTITSTVLANGELLDVISGQIFVGLWEGDQGPNGLVGTNGALLSLNGHARITFDPVADVFTSFQLNGTATDLCALLA